MKTCTAMDGDGNAECATICECLVDVHVLQLDCYIKWRRAYAQRCENK